MARVALAIAYKHRHEGVTYSARAASGELSFRMGFEMPSEEVLSGEADASWSDRSLIGMVIMFWGGAVLLETKKAALADSSTEVEGIASSKCAEHLTVAIEMARGMGYKVDQPTLLRTDNMSSLRISNCIKSTARAKHALRRYYVLQERVRRGEIRIEHVPTAQNKADYLTKWLSAAKLNESVAAASGRAHRDAAVPNKQRTEASCSEC